MNRIAVSLLIFLCFNTFSSLQAEEKITSYLSDEQLESYDRDGFLIIENFVSSDDCDILRKEMLSIVEAYDPTELAEIYLNNDFDAQDKHYLHSGDKISFFMEDDVFLPDGQLAKPKEFAISRVGHALHDLNPIFSAFSRTQKLKQLTADIGISNPLLMQSMYMFKQPFIGGEIYCHQDGSFLYTEPDTTVAYWFALEDATIENGCLWALPGGHKTPLKEKYMVDENGNSYYEIYDESEWETEGMVPLVAPKGSLVILHGFVPHLSKENRSAHSRHAYILHVVSGDAQFPASNWLRRPSGLPFRGFEID